MAKKLAAISSYSPRIILRKTVDTQEFVDWIANRNPFIEGTIKALLYSLHDALLFYIKNGHSVKIEGIGIFSPRIENSGKYNLYYTPDRKIKGKLNKPGIFKE